MNVYTLSYRRTEWRLDAVLVSRIVAKSMDAAIEHFRKSHSDFWEITETVLSMSGVEIAE